MNFEQKRESARKDYESGMKYKDIAQKYDVSLNTVKSWKTRYKWQRAPTKKGVHTKNEKCAHKKETDAAIDNLNNSSLTDKQKAFVLEYLRIYNATQAYINVYGATYNTAKTNGPKLLENAGVQAQIKQIRAAKLHELSIEPFDLIEDIAKEAKADIGDYVSFGSWPELLTEVTKSHKKFKDKAGHELAADVVENKPILDSNGHKVYYHHSYLYFKDQDKVDTTLIKKIKMGKDGPVIELQDKGKAREQLLDWLPKPETDKDINNYELLQAQLAKAKADAQKTEANARIAKHEADQLENNKYVNPEIVALSNLLKERMQKEDDITSETNN